MSKRPAPTSAAVENLMQQLMGMGFTRYQAKTALSLSNNNLESAMELIFELPATGADGDDGVEEEARVTEKNKDSNTASKQEEFSEDFLVGLDEATIKMLQDQGAIPKILPSKKTDTPKKDEEQKQAPGPAPSPAPAPSSGGSSDSSDENFRLVCPKCTKPNALITKFCTGCSCPLDNSHKKKVSPNVFLDIINGTAKDANVLFRSDEFLVFDDKFGVSDGHVDVIPVKEIKDISVLTKDDVPMLEKLYALGKAEILKKNLPSLKSKKFEKFVFFGFNFPISVPHLHLHVIAAPFKHEKVMVYPRWHPYSKVISDLKTFGTVKCYDRFADVQAGKKHEETVLAAHKFLKKPLGDQFEDLFMAWKASKKKEMDRVSPNLFFIETLEQKNCVVFNLHTDEFTLKYPTGSESTFSVQGSSRLSWIQDLNSILAEKKTEEFSEVLDIMCEVIARPKTATSKKGVSQPTKTEQPATASAPSASSTSSASTSAAVTPAKPGTLRSSETDEYGEYTKTSLSQSNEIDIDYEDIDENSFFGGNSSTNIFVGTDWPRNSWFADCVRKEFLAAQNFCGKDIISLFGACIVSVKISVKIDAQVATALEIDSTKPIFIHFDFSGAFNTEKGFRASMPKFTCSQDIKKQYASDFGVKYHLTSIVNSYIEDVWKWAGSADQLARQLGRKNEFGMEKFIEDKGHNNNFEEWRNKRLKGQKMPKTTPAVPVPAPAPTPTEPAKKKKITSEELLQYLTDMSYQVEVCKKLIGEIGINVDAVMEKLIGMGPEAIDSKKQMENATSFQGKTLAHKIDDLVAMGVAPDVAETALVMSDEDVDKAIAYIFENQTVLETSSSSSKTSTPKKQEDKRKDTKVDEDINIAISHLCKSNTNFFLGLIAYFKNRLSNYFRFCMICHKQHTCKSTKPVVCCDPVCIFRYAEIFPKEKKQRIRQIDRIVLCPFMNCFGSSRYNNANMAILATMNDNVQEKDGGNTQEMLLEMHAHRYLPNDQVVHFLEEGIKGCGVKIHSIENVLKPELVENYENRWRALKKQRGDELATPKIAFHGTADTNIESILERGLLVPGKGKGKDVGHATDTGYWGGGIYLSPNAQTSVGYCRGGKKLLVVSVLMGKAYTVTNRMDGADCQAGYDSHIACGGNEWVLFDPDQVLPCYLIAFQQGY